MANEYLDEYEQGEAVKKWLRQNGSAIVIGISLGLAVLYAWRYWWPDYQNRQVMAATRDYAALVQNLAIGQEATRAKLDAFRDEHGNSGFTALAALQLANKAIEDLNFDEAIDFLTFASEHITLEPLRAVAGLRLARVQLQAGQLDQALATVQRYEQGGFEGLAAEIRGDILLAQGDRTSARQAYQTAVDKGFGGAGSLLQLKLEDLAVVTTPQAAPSDFSSDDISTQPPRIDSGPAETAIPDGEPLEGPIGEVDSDESGNSEGQNR